MTLSQLVAQAVTFDASWHVVRDIAEPFVLAGIGWAFRAWIASLRKHMEDVVTASVAKANQDMMTRMGLNFRDHESNAFARLEKIDSHVESMQQEISDLKRTLDEINRMLARV